MRSSPPEHEACIRDIGELRWHLRRRREAAGALQEKLAGLELADGRLREDVAAAQRQGPLLGEKTERETRLLEELTAALTQVKLPGTVWGFPAGISGFRESRTSGLGPAGGDAGDCGPAATLGLIATLGPVFPRVFLSLAQLTFLALSLHPFLSLNVPVYATRCVCVCCKPSQAIFKIFLFLCFSDITRGVST